MSFPCCFHWINRRLSCFRARGCNLILLESLNLDFTPWGMWCHFSFAELFLVILLGHILYYLENSKNMMLYHLKLVWLVHPIVFVDPYWVIFTVNSVKALHWQDLVSVCKKIISFVCWCGISQMHISSLYFDMKTWTYCASSQFLLLILILLNFMKSPNHTVFSFRIFRIIKGNGWLSSWENSSEWWWRKW